jgi:hypothetical protein
MRYLSGRKKKSDFIGERHASILFEPGNCDEFLTRNATKATSDDDIAIAEVSGNPKHIVRLGSGKIVVPFRHAGGL